VVIVVRLLRGFDYAVDSYEIDGHYIELRRTSASGKQQLTTLPLEDILDIQQPSLNGNPMHLSRELMQTEAGKLPIES
jgi:hypothetical protein